MTNEPTRHLIELTLAQDKALALLAAIEASGIIAAGRTEQQIERDIYTLARQDFGVKRHWHQRVVRSGPNTMIAGADVPARSVAEDDIVFIDLGPVFGVWEGDVGGSYVIGNDPEKHRLCGDLPVVFEAIKARYEAEPGITGADLYRFACEAAQQRGWQLGSKIAGHVVGQFPLTRVSGDPRHHVISADNERPMNAPDAAGNPQYWIIEVRLASLDGRFSGFYERLMQTARLDPAPITECPARKG